MNGVTNEITPPATKNGIVHCPESDTRIYSRAYAASSNDAVISCGRKVAIIFAEYSRRTAE